MWLFHFKKGQLIYIQIRNMERIGGLFPWDGWLNGPVFAIPAFFVLSPKHGKA
jgi:hypothetical protein